MFIFFKYFVYFLIFLSLLLFYFLFTPLGHANIYHFIGEKLSKKNGVLIEVQSINIAYYPQVRIVLNIEKKAKLTLWGHLDDALVDMDYTLRSDCIASEHCQIDDDIKIKGHVKGPFTKLFITGKGKALDGNVTYQAVKYTDKVENVTLHLHDVNATKLAHLLGQKAFLKGKSNANVNFSLMNDKEKHGTIVYDVDDKNFKGIAIHLHSNITINNDQHTFSIRANAPELTFNIDKGNYNQKTKQTKASYRLDVKSLHNLTKLLGYAYHGALYTKGEILYTHTLKITGVSKSFGGVVNFLFENHLLHMQLQNVSLENIMHLFDFPSILTAKTNGKIVYSFPHETLHVHTTLNQAKFLPSKLVDVVQKKSHVDMKRETFENSILDFTYYHHAIQGYLKLINPKSHVYLTNTKIETQKSTIDAYFDFKMQQQEFSGKVYGALESPKVNLNMQKLIRYQMDKQVDKMIGKDGRKMMEHMPMGGVAKDMATDMGASFMKVFF